MRRLALLLLLLAALAAGCGGGEDSEAGDDTTGGEVTECEEVDAPDAREPGQIEAPTEALDTSKIYSLVFETSCGSFIVALDSQLAPNTVPSLVALAEDG